VKQRGAFLRELIAEVILDAAQGEFPIRQKIRAIIAQRATWVNNLLLQARTEVARF
jgi:hypothetical protein